MVDRYFNDGNMINWTKLSAWGSFVAISELFEQIGKFCSVIIVHLDKMFALGKFCDVIIIQDGNMFPFPTSESHVKLVMCCIRGILL